MIHRVLLAVLLGSGAVMAQEAPTDPVVDQGDTPGGKEDVVVLHNGDLLTCEIEELEWGILTVSTDAMGTVRIEWDEVARIESKRVFRIELLDGSNYFGSLEARVGPGSVRVATEDGAEDLHLPQLARITSYEEDRWDRLGGYVNLGFDFTRSSDVLQFNVGAGLSYATEIDLVKLDFTTILTEQEGRDTVTRADSSLDYRRFLGNRWFVLAGGSLEHNETLGIDLRRSLQAGGGHALIQQPDRFLALAAGLNASREDVSGAGSDQDNLEAFVSADFTIFDYDTPKTDLRSSVVAYPSLTEAGRLRLDFQASLRQELVEDFFLDLTVYTNYDSDPPTATADTTDYGILLSVGYSF